MSLLRDSAIVCRRQLRTNLRSPAWIIIGVAQPVMYLLLFAPLLKPLAGQFGAANPYTFFVPGLVVQMGLFGALYAGFGLLAEWRDGVIEAERVTPASRAALLIGRLARDLVQLTVQCLILVALGYVFGMRAPLPGAGLGVLMALALGASGSALSSALALSTKREDIMGPLINMVTMPIILLSGILLPMTLGPDWLRRLSELMPIRYVVDGVRAAFDGHLGDSGALWGVAVTAALLVISLAWATAVFRREQA